LAARPLTADASSSEKSPISSEKSSIIFEKSPMSFEKEPSILLGAPHAKSSAALQCV